MSQFYSTGELANLAGVSIRTVQYYDQRGILTPTALTEGGRRLYTDSDLEQLRMICFLRDLGFSIEQIRKVLAEENAAQVLELLLVDHIATAKEDLAAKEQQVDIAVKILDRLRKQDPQSLDFLMDVSLSMKNQKAWKKRFVTLIVCLTVETLLFVAGAYLLQLTIWKYFLIPVFFLFLLGTLYWYYQNISYLCPSCHQIFEAKWTEFALAGHTPRTRKLTCPHCHQKSYCLELAKEDTVSRG
ncbi:MerR family transcriptional regulator [Streptococcus dysgalactiae]|uniref:MerR family transcriptional regulator n=1 Tax=Streptococcus dysgalactiae TaxID=1334 RepID=UPI0001F86054|nr:MerR family transcriptional regulator [Streptococcus dysgalactiae]EFY03597.1 MerR family transcriptional regulator [Streptococcus dysgalactiae subsp. dysgalactiae ATCC 27957]MCB2847460.1 MerR family transcriptional regulator [Streptococcus dysgalactiae subsp. dysgalactiae]QQT03516.1 MerR family transcriptional regulator [Streptococcus dysgalactiae]SUN47795.1 HTH-type transcriptional regulator hmrR [Streptococcus dysgalactiae subsp. dysgalactiae]SUN52126.1 HTH-type transcriptional regulator 